MREGVIERPNNCFSIFLRGCNQSNLSTLRSANGGLQLAAKVRQICLCLKNLSAYFVR